MKLKSLFATSAIVLMALMSSAQTSLLVVNQNINLPKDSIERTQLISALDDFLIAAQQPNEENKWVLPSEKIETYILLDEINGMGKSGRFKDDNFYKPYLTNTVKLTDSTWLVQVSYIGVAENNPLLRANFKLIAHRVNVGFSFSSPFTINVAHWNKDKAGDCTIYSKTSVNKAKAMGYEKVITSFDKKLNAPKQKEQTEIYICNNLPEALNTIGVEYKSDYNGRPNNRLTSQMDHRSLIVDGLSYQNGMFDPHDVWHDRLHNIVPRSVTNKAVDEGCAYLYAGSWMMSWKEIFQKFKTRVCSNKQINWAEAYEKFDNFGDSPETHLMVAYVINALIVQKIEKEQGFSAVMELLKCGKYQKGNENYYAVLERLTGITKANFNEKVWELINNEK